jgi:hypothetical protein
VFLAGAIGIALVTMAFDQPSELVRGDWEPTRPWYWPEQPLAPLEVGLMVCMYKTPDSPVRVCYATSVAVQLNRRHLRFA